MTDILVTPGPTVGDLPAAPPPVLLAASGLGLGAAVVIPAGAPGLGLVLLGLAVAILLTRLAPTRVRGWRAVHAGAALLLLGSAGLRDAPWLVGLDLAAALALGSLAVAGGRTWAGLLRGLIAVALALPRGLGWWGRGVAASRPEAAAAGPVLRGLALTGLLLAVFGGLLASGDAVFAQATAAVIPDLPDLGLLPVRALVGVLAAAAVAAATLVLTSPRAEPVVGAPLRRLTRAAEWLLPLVALDALLTAFVVVQSTVLFGGQDHVLSTVGLSYAEYARAGFFQMVAVAVLALAVVAASVRWAPRSARPALGLLCALALVVDASALYRLQLYAAEYGLTRLRVATSALTIWLGVVLLLVLVAGLRPGLRPGLPSAHWLPHTVVATAAAGLLALTLANPDARIADSLLDRGGAADISYLDSLSADAVPALDRLAEPARSCVLAGRGGSDGWLSANVGRHRAAAILERRPPTPSVASCYPS